MQSNWNYYNFLLKNGTIKYTKQLNGTWKKYSPWIISIAEGAFFRDPSCEIFTWIFGPLASLFFRATEIETAIHSKCTEWFSNTMGMSDIGWYFFLFS